MGSTTTKIVKGRRYLYFVYYEDGKRMEKYCGLDSDLESHKKATRFRIINLKEKRDVLVKRIDELGGSD